MSNTQPTQAERSADYFVQWGWILSLFGVGGFLLWAALAPLDQGVSVPATVVVSGNRKTVQSAAPGMVTEIRVRDGQRVKKGQALIYLDPTQIAANVEALSTQRLIALATLARWQSERDDLAQINFPDAVSQNPSPSTGGVIQAQRQLFESRRQALTQQQAATLASTDGSVAQLNGAEHIASSLSQQAASLREQINNLRPLATGGYIPRNRLLELQRQLTQLEQQVAQNRAQQQQLKHQVRELKLQHQQQIENYQKEVRSQLTQAQLSSLTLEQQLTAALFSLEHSIIKAPSTGIAMNLSVHSVGAVVSANQTLLEIVPQDTPLEIEGKLPVHLIDKIAVHLPVDIMFSAFEQSSTPRVAGEVSLISADQLINPQTAMPYYIVRSSISDTALKNLNGLLIKPGMPAEMFIRSGERSLLNYLFKPLFDRTSNALTER